MSTIPGVPRVPPGVSARPRLTAVLDEGAPLCVLRSPGGTGKTTVLAQWVSGAARSGEAVAWITIDPRTQSRAGFWVRVLTHLHRADLLDDATFYRELATVADSGGLVRAAVARALDAVGPLLLVVDNFAVAGEFWDDVSHDLVALLRHAPQVRCVVAGRFPTLLEGPTAAAAVDTRVLDDESMALTDDEVRDIVAQSGLPLDTSAVAALTERTASRSVHDLRYALELLSRRDGSAAEPSADVLTAPDIASSVPAQVREDLAARIGDPEVMEFLGATALAPHADVVLARTLAEALDTGQDGEQLLGVLEHEGIGYWSERGRSGSTFRLSDHVRAVAAARFASDHPRKAAQVLAAISRWLLTQRHDAFGAIEYALRAGDLDLADHLVLRAFPLPPQDHARLARQLGSMSGAKIRARPVLSVFYGLYLNARRGTQPRALEFFVAAARATRGRAPARAPAERVVLLALEGTIWRLLGHPGRMRDRARRALREYLEARDDADLAPDLAAAGELDPVLAVALEQVALSLLAGDDLAGARRAYDAVSTLAAERGWAHHANVAACGRAMLAVVEGRLDNARAELAGVRPEAWPAPWLNGYVGAFRNVAQAWVHIDDGEPTAALEELALLDPHVDTIEHWEPIASARSVAEAMTGRVEEAEARLNQVGRARSGPTTLPSARGRLASARRILQLASGTARGTSGRRVRGQTAALDFALRAYAAAVHGTGDDAVALLAQAQSAATTPLHEALNAVVGIVVAHRTSAGLDAGRFANQLAAVVQAVGLHWPVTLLAEEERAALLGAPTLPGATGAVLAAAFASVPPIVDERLWDQSPVPTLTARERDVLRVLAETGVRAEIAEILHVSVNTVKAQLRSTYTKLGVRTREEALTRAVALGLLAEPEEWPGDAAPPGAGNDLPG